MGKVMSIQDQRARAAKLMGKVLPLLDAVSKIPMEGSK